MDRGAWWATVHGVAKSQTRLSNFTFAFKAVCCHPAYVTYLFIFFAYVTYMQSMSCEMLGLMTHKLES